MVTEANPKITADDSHKYRGTSLAIDGQGIYFYFDRKKETSVLNGINISVPRGIIYSLLGPSGCGKTTLLKCIIGQHKVEEGSLRVYGKPPRSKGSFIPGRGVGYMPQDVALYFEMTIEEILTFFGSLYHMKRQEIKERISFLIELLALPNKKRQIKCLSGGQQRRVSFAAALIHKPPLLILDEPTVGADPLLRQAIWNYLVDLVSNERMTVIITTHYIEEARQANIVGLMRGGRLLAERNPEDLIKEHGVLTLEDVFLSLCQKIHKKENNLTTSSNGLFSDESHRPNSSTQNSTKVWLTGEDDEPLTDKKLLFKSEEAFILSKVKVDSPFQDEENRCNGNSDERNDVPDNTTALLSPSYLPDSTDFRSSSWASWVRFSSLVNKNWLRLRRSVVLMLFQMCVPAIQIVIFCLCVGADPFDLNMAVVNKETDPHGYGTNFLRSINNRTVHQKHFDNLNSALESIRKGESWGAIYINPEFTICLRDRLFEGIEVTNATVECSNIGLYMDMSNQQIAFTIYSSLLKSFQTFTTDVLQIMGISPVLASPPLKIEDPVYGNLQTSFIEFLAPGVILSITYIMAVGLTEMVIILEKKQGLLERTFVAGASSVEVVLSFFITLQLVLFVQIILVLAITFLIFGIPCNGSFFWVLVAALLAGLGGMAYGLFISAICEDENGAVMIAIGSFYPTVLMSGVIWPVEAMPYYLRYCSYCLPLTLISNSLRSILIRGWNITDNYVWDGYLICSAWIIIFLILSVLLFRIKK